ncbi:MAG: tetratricopeptide repeat protein, partial [Lachnospiraceae bacterium]|nr:tetratricopeptide repeat protein [Lachnospiraceae bacterium]
MSLFGKKNKEVWRDKEGKIRCLGDACPVECDDSCPIWLNTQGLSMLSIQQPKKAIEIYEKALAIAPDFVDAWNNLGTSYGINDEHEKAFGCFKKAYNMVGRATSLSGMAVSQNKLGREITALQLCDEYDKKFGEGQLDSLRKSIINSALNDNSKSLFDYRLLKLSKIGKKDGTIQNNSAELFPGVPKEISSEAAVTVGQTIKKMNEYCADKIIGAKKTLQLAAVWSALTGVGARCLYEKDNHIFESYLSIDLLWKPLGFEHMDEYVSQLIGMRPNGEEIKHLMAYFENAFLEIYDDYYDKEDDPTSRLSDCCRGMFYFENG